MEYAIITEKNGEVVTRNVAFDSHESVWCHVTHLLEHGHEVWFWRSL